jgi:putative transcriptional regulator
MAIVRKTIDPRNLPKPTPEQEAALDALTDEEITRAAERDPDNPPLTEEELAKVAAIQLIRRARERTGLSQAKFAERFHINHARLRDWERGRFLPDSAALAYLKVIEQDPKAVEKALKAA